MVKISKALAEREAAQRGEGKRKQDPAGRGSHGGYQDPPWLDVRLPTEAMNFLWDSINQSTTRDARLGLAGNLTKSEFIQDKDNYFYDNVLKECSEILYYKDWVSYFSVNIAKTTPPFVFVLKDLWVNYQKQHEFNPPHVHAGIYSFVVFMKIPTHWKEQHKLPMSANSRIPQASNFQFLMGQNLSSIKTTDFFLSPEDEGRMLFFPASLHHQVFPFYECEEDRVTISGNIFMKNLDED